MRSRGVERAIGMKIADLQLAIGQTQAITNVVSAHISTGADVDSGTMMSAIDAIAVLLKNVEHCADEVERAESKPRRVRK